MTEFQPQTGFLDTQGAPLYYEVAGTGQPLLLIHSGNPLHSCGGGIATCRSTRFLAILIS